MAQILSGLIPACHTPFHPDGRLNLSVVEQQAALYREEGLRGVFVAGTTGEFASLTVEERKALCERLGRHGRRLAAGGRACGP